MELVSLLKADSYQEDLQTKLITLVKPLGGFEAFFKRGDRVLLKPNFVLPRPVESATTTHPAMIITLAALLKDMGCEVAVGDSPGFGSVQIVARKLNLLDDLNLLGVKIIELETPAKTDPEDADSFIRRFKNLHLAAELKQFNKIINLPKLKSHGQMGLTLATKNLYGCVAGPVKGQWHYAAGKDLKYFARLLMEVALTVNATLHILDGIIGMDGNGPSHGRVRQFNLLLAGTNPIALDRVVVELLQKKAEQFPIFEAAQEMAIPGTVLAQIEVKGEDIGSCYVKNFEIPSFSSMELIFRNNKALSLMIESLVKARLVINHKRCTKCRRCEMQCPAKAINLNKNKVFINKKICINCCCCQELCPEGALAVKDPLIVKIIKSIWKFLTRMNRK